MALVSFSMNKLYDEYPILSLPQAPGNGTFPFIPSHETLDLHSIDPKCLTEPDTTKETILTECNPWELILLG